MWNNLPNLFSWQDFLLTEEDYDLKPASKLWQEDKTLSATTLCKPDRQLLFTIYQEHLLNTVPKPINSSSNFAKFIGHAIHTYIEGKIQKDYPSMFHEERISKELMGCTISGKPDIIKNGKVIDIKTTHSFALHSPEKIAAYTKQLSIYRWLNPELITDDEGLIIYIVKDWKEGAAGYGEMPMTPVVEVPIPLWSEIETERYITKKILLLTDNTKMAYKNYPKCDPADLPRKPPIYKIYKAPNYKRAIKNFSNLMEATSYLVQNPGKQYELKEIKSECAVCKYCPFKDFCSQYQEDTSPPSAEPDFSPINE